MEWPKGRTGKKDSKNAEKGSKNAEKGSKKRGCYSTPKRLSRRRSYKSSERMTGGTGPSMVYVMLPT